MRPRNRLRRRWSRSRTRLVPILLGLMLILAPALDGAAEAGLGSMGGGQPTSLDLCVVPGAILAPPPIRPPDPTARLNWYLDLPCVPLVAQVSDPPPRSA